jgi:potassium efflux system protein
VLWSDLFPALRILDQVTLWQHTLMVDGEPQVLPITLASVGMALFYGVITVILAKQLPAVLEILLLKLTEMGAGGRYTVTTLANYLVVTTGAVLVFKTIGADWSQLQWLVAALGVGIGFGLQEIVANFISGIIVLFERPIRIGDVITIGDTDGKVTKIRSRATTIRNWDGKELLVPNKEFITGRLLNWSLSDQVTRVILSVGIAYGSDVRLAMRLLEEAARENENVLDDPAPSVIFETFGDNALGLLLRGFVDSTDLRFPTVSALNQAINDKFNAAGIVIAFPQRDLHLHTSQPLQVELRGAAEVEPSDRT